MGWEEANAEQVDGGWGKSVAVSVLAAVALHGEWSVYVLGYERTRTVLGGRAPDLLPEVAARLGEIPEARAELEVLQRKLVERHPELGAALERAEEPPPGAAPLREDGEAGAPPLPLHPRASRPRTWPWVGPSFPWREGLPYWEVGPEGKAKALAGFLRKSSPLKVLPHGAVPALLRGRGDPKEAARLVLLSRAGRACDPRPLFRGRLSLHRERPLLRGAWKSGRAGERESPSARSRRAKARPPRGPKGSSFPVGAGRTRRRPCAARVASMKGEAYWVLTAPLGELPEGEALERQARDLKEEDGLYRDHLAVLEHRPGGPRRPRPRRRAAPGGRAGEGRDLEPTGWTGPGRRGTPLGREKGSPS
jgi:hypothetical protein